MADPGDHLTANEAAQLLLHPTADAIDAYADTSEHARTQLVEISIDTTAMVVWVGWIGGILDPATDLAFAAITAETGIDVKIISRRFSREDMAAAMEKIFRTQDGVQVTSGYGDVIVATVGWEVSLDGRPPEVSPPGKILGIPVRYEHGQVDLLATRQHDSAPETR